MTGTSPSPATVPLFRRAREHGDRFALAAPEGVFTYRELLEASARVARALLGHREPPADGGGGERDGEPGGGLPGAPTDPPGPGVDLAEGRVAYLVPPGFSHVAVQWGIWRAGGVAVSLAPDHPPPEWARVLDDARPETVVAGPAAAERLRPLAAERGIALRVTAELGLPVEVPRRGGADAAGSAADDLRPPGEPGGGAPGAADEPFALPALTPDRRALIVYTSGTTGEPKGAVHTHGSLEAQVRGLVEAWEWSADDHILLVLPLHHVHGIVNVLTCALWSGACCQVLPAFDAAEVWERFARGDLTLFMAVPTIYHRLIRVWEEADGETRGRWSAGAGGLRLMVSGSAALPVRTLERWREITGHTLLERYGMTEAGMILSDPLEGERRPGCVGRPLPGVEVRRVDGEGRVVEDPAAPAELEIRGPSLFLEYRGRPGETEAAFRDGWFRTGDVAVVEDGHYRLLGRKSVDILKTGGYKVSALEIEETLREHPAVEACAVVGVPDEDWGQRVVGAGGAAGGEAGTAAAHGDGGAAGEIGGAEAEGPGGPPPASAGLPAELRAFLRARLAPYKVPKEIRLVEGLPRNAVGKVRKPAVAELFTRADGAGRDVRGGAGPADVEAGDGGPDAAGRGGG